ncbi:MAG: hypothetical protein Q7N50_06160 [Armatimonadota bacterium]|nr:hypothetical protein [Armatimonadota bacterium]
MSLRTPPDWNLVAVSGDENKGYFRVDSPTSAAVEVRWSILQKPPDNLNARAEEYLETLRKAARKRKISFSAKVKSRKPTPAEENFGGGSVGFTWRSDKNAYGRLLYCGYCKRLVIGQVVSDSGRDISGLSTSILSSICEHEEPGWNVWAMYDLQVSVPDKLKLRRHTLMSSFVELEFASRKDKLVIQRWGLAANTLLKKQSLEEWADKVYMPGIAGYKTSRTSEDDAHKSLMFTGKRGVKTTLLSLPMGLMGKPLPRNIRGHAWFCEESNKIYAVRHYHTGESDLARIIKEKIACH